MIWKNSRTFTRLINLLNFKTYVLICNCVQFQCLKHIYTSRKITVAERYVYIKISERKMCLKYAVNCRILKYLMQCSDAVNYKVNIIFGQNRSSSTFSIDKFGSYILLSKYYQREVNELVSLWITGSITQRYKISIFWSTQKTLKLIIKIELKVFSSFLWHSP